MISPHCQLLVCGSKRGSRWNLAALSLVNDPARPQAGKTPTPIPAHVGRAYHHKWWNVLSAAARQQSACLTCVDYWWKGQRNRGGESPLSGATGSGVCPGSYIRSASLGKNFGGHQVRMRMSLWPALDAISVIARLKAQDEACSSAAELEQGEGLARNRPLMKRGAFSSSQCRLQHAYGGGMISVEA